VKAFCQKFLGLGFFVAMIQGLSDDLTNQGRDDAFGSELLLDFERAVTAALGFRERPIARERPIVDVI
jgi:hypothetical protein